MEKKLPPMQAFALDLIKTKGPQTATQVASAWREHKLINDPEYTFNSKRGHAANAMQCLLRLKSAGYLQQSGPYPNVVFTISPAAAISNFIESLKYATYTDEPVAECTGFCGMNYCDENGCTNRGRNYAELAPLESTPAPIGFRIRMEFYSLINSACQSIVNFADRRPRTFAFVVRILAAWVLAAIIFGLLRLIS